jgi:hypothetical protein
MKRSVALATVAVAVAVLIPLCAEADGSGAQSPDGPTPVPRDLRRVDPAGLDIRGREYEVERQLRMKPGNAPQLEGPPR